MAIQVKPLIGVGGILIAAAAAELNDEVTSAALRDIAGGLGISHDPSTWITSLYVSAEVFGMALAPWMLVTFSIRQFALFAILLNAVSTVLIPFAPALPALYILRIMQGLSGGLTIPLLMTGALRVLEPSVKVYGFAIYALTATFFPAMAEPLAALWTYKIGWQFVFFESLPLCAMAAVLAWWGLPQDPPQYERLRKFDWSGALLLLVGFGSLTTLLQQGDRLDWFNSPTMCVLALLSVVAIPLLIVNEWFHELPLLKIQMLGRPNLAYGAIALFAFLIVGQSASVLPAEFLQEVAGYRPEQTYPITLLIALSQLALLPLAAFILDHPFFDARVVHGAGLVMVLIANIGASFVTADWNRNQLFLWEGLEAVGQPLVVMSLLLLATNTVKGPEEAPYASALVNMPRAVAEATGVWVIQLTQRWRGALHYNRLADQAGQERFGVLQGAVSPTHPGGASVRAFAEALNAQAMVLTISDIYLVFAAMTAGLIVVLILMTQYSPPPRVLAAQQ